MADAHRPALTRRLEAFLSQRPPHFHSAPDGCPDSVPGADSRALCDLAADISAVDIANLPPRVRHPANWDAYVDELIELWRRTEMDLSESIPMLRYVAAWLQRNRPPEVPMTLVHGEFQPGNVM